MTTDPSYFLDSIVTRTGTGTEKVFFVFFRLICCICLYQETKVVLLEDLAAHFKMKTQDAIDRVKALQESGDLTGAGNHIFGIIGFKLVRRGQSSAKKSMRFRSALGVHKSGVYNFLSILLNASKTISAGNFDKPQLVNYCKGKEKAQERLVSCSWYLNPT